MTKKRPDESWDELFVRNVGRAMKKARGSMSARVLSDKTAELGYRVSPTVIAKLDSGHRGSILNITELLVIAAALGVPPVTLLFSGPPDVEVEVLPGDKRSLVQALAWFSGDRELGWPGPEVKPNEARDQANATVRDPDSPSWRLLELMRERAARYREMHMASRGLSQVDSERFGPALEHMGRLTEDINAINTEIHRLTDTEEEAE